MKGFIIPSSSAIFRIQWSGWSPVSFFSFFLSQNHRFHRIAHPCMRSLIRGRPQNSLWSQNLMILPSAALAGKSAYPEGSRFFQRVRQMAKAQILAQMGFWGLPRYRIAHEFVFLLEFCRGASPAPAPLFMEKESTAWTRPDESFEKPLRPQSFSDFVLGQRELMSRLSVTMQAAQRERKHARPLPLPWTSGSWKDDDRADPLERDGKQSGLPLRSDD